MMKIVCFLFAILSVSAIFSLNKVQDRVCLGVHAMGCEVRNYASEVLDLGAEVISEGVAMVEVCSRESVNIADGNIAKVERICAGECGGDCAGESCGIANCLSIK